MAKVAPFHWKAGTGDGKIQEDVKGIFGMPATMKTMGIDQLTVPERLALVQDIWDSIAEDSERAPLSDEQKQEIDLRLHDYENNPESAVPWEQVEAEAMARMKT